MIYGEPRCKLPEFIKDCDIFQHWEDKPCVIRKMTEEERRYYGQAAKVMTRPARTLMQNYVSERNFRGA